MYIEPETIDTPGSDISVILLTINVSNLTSTPISKDDFITSQREHTTCKIYVATVDLPTSQFSCDHMGSSSERPNWTGHYNA